MVKCRNARPDASPHLPQLKKFRFGKGGLLRWFQVSSHWRNGRNGSLAFLGHWRSAPHLPQVLIPKAKSAAGSSRGFWRIWREPTMLRIARFILKDFCNLWKTSPNPASSIFLFNINSLHEVVLALNKVIGVFLTQVFARFNGQRNSRAMTRS